MKAASKAASYPSLPFSRHRVAMTSSRRAS